MTLQDNYLLCYDISIASLLCQLFSEVNGLRATFNEDIRDAIRAAGLFGYQVAAAIGISETSFSRAMARGELTEERKKQILEVCHNAETAGTE